MGSVLEVLPECTEAADPHSDTFSLRPFRFWRWSTRDFITLDTRELSCQDSMSFGLQFLVLYFYFIFLLRKWIKCDVWVPQRIWVWIGPPSVFQFYPESTLETEGTKAASLSFCSGNKSSESWSVLWMKVQSFILVSAATVRSQAYEPLWTRTWFLIYLEGPSEPRVGRNRLWQQR